MRYLRESHTYTNLIIHPIRYINLRSLIPFAIHTRTCGEMAIAASAFRSPSPSPQTSPRFSGRLSSSTDALRCNLRSLSSSRLFNNGCSQSTEGRSRGRSSSWKLNAFPDWPLMAVMVEHVALQRDFVVHKSVWHLSDEAIKNVYTFYIMFTCWGCCVFGSTKDPFYDSEEYRKDGGDGTVHWFYEKQEDIEQAARAELLREELLEEIEQKVGGLRELEEASREEELAK